MASPKRRAGAFFGLATPRRYINPNFVALYTGYNSVLYWRQTPMASMCSIRSPCRIGYFYFTPNAAHARHGSSIRKKHRFVALDKLYNFSSEYAMLQASPDPKEWRPPVALCHGFALQKWSASRQNFLEGGPRTFPGIASLKLVNRFEHS